MPTDVHEHCTSPSEQRRAQIMDAALACFSRRGFHQTTMHHISEEAGISVGLIYRYFESKEQVIATMANEHVGELQRRLREARQLPTLFDAIEKVVWCDEHDPDVAASFIVDLFAESARNVHVRGMVGRVHEAVIVGVSELVASSPEARHLAPGLSPRQAAETVFHAIHGLMFDEILQLDSRSQDEIRGTRSEVLRRMLSVLFPALHDAPARATESHDAP